MDFLTLALCKKASGGIIPTKVSDLSNDAGYITSSALNGYALESVVNAALATKANQADVNAALALKANSADVTAQIAAAIGSVSSFEYYLCGNGEYDPQTGVPTVQNPDTEHIYLVPTSGTNLNMYAYIGNSFTFLGTTEVDLTGYVQETDLEDYVKSEDLPTVPTKVSQLENDAEYITNPRTVLYSVTPNAENDLGPGFAGGLDHVYMYTREATAEDIAALQSVAESTDELYIVRSDLPLQMVVDGNGVNTFTNVVPTSTGAASGMDVADPTKPTYLIRYTATEEPGLYVLMAMGSESIVGKTLQIFKPGAYLTEHQSLAGYAKTADVNTALAGKQNTLQFDDAPTQSSTKMLTSGKIYTALAGKQDKLTFDQSPTANSKKPVESGGVYTALAGKSNTGHTHAYSELTGQPTIPTVPTISTNITSDAASDLKTASPKAVKTYVDGKVPSNIVTGDGASYTIKVATSAPASGTSSSIITIVVPE